MGYRNNKSVADLYLNPQPMPLQSVPQPMAMPLPQMAPIPSPLDPVEPQPISMPQASPQAMSIKPEFIDTPKEQAPIAPQGPMMIPTFDQTTTTSQQNQTTGVDAKSAAAIRSAAGDEQKALMDLSGVEAKKAGQLSLSKEEQAAIQGQQIIAEKQAREEQRAKELDAQKQLDASAQDMLKYEFDQDRVWKRMGTAGSIAAGVGIALGALAQGFGAKSNAAIDAIDKQIQRDIEQQRMEYEKIKDKTKAQESAYGRLRQLGMDDSQARAQLNKASLDQIQTKLESGLAKLGVEEAPLIAAQSTAAARTKLEDSLKGTNTKGFSKNTAEQKGMKIGGGAPLSQKERVELVQATDKDQIVAPYRNAKMGLAKFKGSLDPKTGRANPVALAEFVSGVTGLNQGSYDPKVFNAAMQSAGIVGRNAEAIRDFWTNEKPVPKDISDNIVKNLRNNVTQSEAAANRRYREHYGPLGLSRESVLGENIDMQSLSRPVGNLK